MDIRKLSDRNHVIVWCIEYAELEICIGCYERASSTSVSAERADIFRN